MNAKKKAPVKGSTVRTPSLDPVKDYARQLMQADTKKLAAKLRLFGIDKVEAMPRIPLICRLKQMGPIVLHPEKKFDPHIGEIRQFVRRITPDSIYTLKELAGVPNHVAERERRRQTSSNMRKVQIHELPVEPKLKFNALDLTSRRALNDMAHNFLHGYIEEAQLQKHPYKAVADYMLGRARDIPTFVARDLIVCPNEKIHFNGFGAVFFLNIIVYGNGEIILGNNTKLHAYHIKHVPA